VKAKFVDCNLVCTEGLPMSTFPAILNSYEAVGVNVGQTHRNERGFKIFCAVMANCIRIAQVTRFQKGDHFTLNLDKTTDDSSETLIDMTLLSGQ